VLDQWRKEYEQHGEAAFTEKEVTEQEALERFCGQLAWENIVLKKALRQVGSRSGTQ
jgi:transposase